MPFTDSLPGIFYIIGKFSKHYSPVTSITSSVSNAVRTISSIFSASFSSERSITEISGFVTGCFATKMVQQSSKGCTIFVAKHPVTKPNLNIIRKHEHNLDEKIEGLVQTALDTEELIIVK